MKFNPRTMLAGAHDIIAAVLAWIIAYWLRFNFSIPPEYVSGMFATLIWVVPIQAFFFWALGLYRGIWRYASIPDLKRILLAVGFAAMTVPLIIVMARISTSIPRSVLVLDPILLVVIMAGNRFAYRAWREYRAFRFVRGEGKPVLIVGAGDAAVSLVKELSRSSEWLVVGLLDDNINKKDRMLHGAKVLGTIATLDYWATYAGAKHAIIAMPSASHQARREIVNLCNQAGLKVLTVPAFADLMSGRVTISQIRAIEVEDLLGREPVELDNVGLHTLLTGHSVMVTGAGGSIGSELCRQIAQFEPKLLVLFEQNEFALYTIEQEFTQAFPALKSVPVIGDIKNAERLAQVLRLYRPAVIFHAAAYKHVPLMETHNTWEAIQNNVMGTYTLARTAVEHGVEKFVLISTDKAVNPTNVMGASKRLAELVCQAMQQESKTRFIMVRFGNVLGSTGSVIPKFHEQIAKGGPITVTHPEITRYFMSIPEAAQLVLQAGLMGLGGEIFVLDMGDPVKISELAKDMIRLSGYSEEDIEIVYTGLRPGEKLYEELLADDEGTLPTPHAKLRIAKARSADTEWLAALLCWLRSEVPPENDVVLKAQLTGWVPEYKPNQAPANVLNFKERRKSV